MILKSLEKDEKVTVPFNLLHYSNKSIPYADLRKTPNIAGMIVYKSATITTSAGEKIELKAGEVIVHSD